MSVGTFNQPAFASSQDGTTYKTSIDNSIAAMSRIGNSFAPHEQASPNMTVRLDAGALFISGALVEVAAQSTATITAPSANPRIDRVVIDETTGAVSVVTGTEAGSPSAPDIPTGKIPICQVLLDNSPATTTIINSLLTDERVPGLLGNQPTDLTTVEADIVSLGDSLVIPAPYITWVDETTLRVAANVDVPAKCRLSGFPNVLHPGNFLNFGITDGIERINTTNVTFTFASNCVGNEVASQWYSLYAVAATGVTTFTLLAIPFTRCHSDSSNVITFRNSLNSSTANYGFTTNIFSSGTYSGSKIIVVTGSYKGTVRAVASNTATTITYSSSSIGMSIGDWFAIIPGNINFKWIGDFYNSASSNIWRFARMSKCFHYIQNEAGVGQFYTAGGGESTAPYVNNGAPPMASSMDLLLDIVLANSDWSTYLNSKLYRGSLTSLSGGSYPGYPAAFWLEADPAYGYLTFKNAIHTAPIWEGRWMAGRDNRSDQAVQCLRYEYPEGYL